MKTAKLNFEQIEFTRSLLEETEKQLQSLHMESKTHDEVQMYVEQRHLVSEVLIKLDSLLSYLNKR